MPRVSENTEKLLPTMGSETKTASWRLGRSALAVALLFHHHAAAAVVVFDAVHEVAHQEHSAPAGILDVVDFSRVGKLIGIEAGPLVDDFDPETLRRQTKTHVNQFVLVEAAAVSDGVDQSLFDGQMHAED